MSDSASTQLGAPLTKTRRARIRPVTGDDYPLLYQLETAPDVLHTWRLRGGLPTDTGAYERGLWLGAYDQRVMERGDDGSLLGLVQLYNVDFRLSSGWFSIISVPSARRTGASMEGMALFLYRCFRTWRLQRIYFSSLAPNFSQFATVANRHGCSVYGTMRERTFLDGVPVDVIYGGIDGGPWLAHYEPILRRLSSQ
jgi:RimJ/RimL family protein N-acetyltransferase